MSHYLYRLFNKNDELLYVGISKSAIHRLHQHLEKQPWAEQVAKQTIERFPHRAALEAAEKVAIQNEHPIHNITHNKPKRDVVVAPDWVAKGVRIGECVALGLFTGECPIGMVEAVDERFIRLVLKDQMSGYYGGPSRAFRVVDVDTIYYAWVKETKIGSLSGEVTRYIEDEHLDRFQERWFKKYGKTA